VANVVCRRVIGRNDRNQAVSPGQITFDVPRRQLFDSRSVPSRTSRPRSHLRSCYSAAGGGRLLPARKSLSHCFHTVVS
jgi:hypothetical protein